MSGLLQSVGTGLTAKLHAIPGASLLFQPAPTHTSILNRLEDAGKGNADWYLRRATTIATVGAELGIPETVGRGVDMARFFTVTGFDAGRYSSADAKVFEEAVNVHLFRMEIGFAKLFCLKRSAGHQMATIGVDMTQVGRDLSFKTFTDFTAMSYQSGCKFAADPVAQLEDHFSRIVERQNPAKATLPLLRTIVDYVGKTVDGVTTAAMDLKFIRHGFVVDPIKILDEDRHLKNGTLTLKTSDGGTTSATLDFCVNLLNDFLAVTSPEARGVKTGTAAYNGALKYLAMAVEHPDVAKAAVRAALETLGPIIFDDAHGKTAREELYRLVSSALSEGNTAYLKRLIRNRQPIDLKPQYLEDVTLPHNNNAWQRTFVLPSGVRVTYGELLRALSDFFSVEANKRYREYSGLFLAKMGAKVAVFDPENILPNISADCDILPNHGSYLDIIGIAHVFRNALHSFAARDNLVFTTLGIGAHLFAALHTSITRTSKEMGRDERASIVEKTFADYTNVTQFFGASLAVFLEKTRSRNGAFQADLYRQSGMTFLRWSKEQGRRAVGVHLRHFGSAFMMLTQQSLGDVLGLRRFNFIEGMRNLHDLQMPVIGTRDIRNLEVHIGPIVDAQDPEAAMEELLAFHQSVEG